MMIIMKCPFCAREFTEAQWSCLPWLQYVGVRLEKGARIKEAMAFEVRRCICNEPVACERSFPITERLLR